MMDAARKPPPPPAEKPSFVTEARVGAPTAPKARLVVSPLPLTPTLACPRSRTGQIHQKTAVFPLCPGCCQLTACLQRYVNVTGGVRASGGWHQRPRPRGQVAVVRAAPLPFFTWCNLGSESCLGVSSPLLSSPPAPPRCLPRPSRCAGNQCWESMQVTAADHCVHHQRQALSLDGGQLREERRLLHAGRPVPALYCVSSLWPTHWLTGERQQRVGRRFWPCCGSPQPCRLPYESPQPCRLLYESPPAPTNTTTRSTY
eukprot:COSAG05_NODE_390_length_10436_cov_15.721196_2_plen_258_part_00